MIVNKQNLKTIFTGLKKTFQNAFDQTPNDWQQIAMVVPSGTKEENYAWLSRFPKMREWLGEKVVKALEAFNYTIRNKDWEATIEVDRNDVEDDTMLGYAQQAVMTVSTSSIRITRSVKGQPPIKGPNRCRPRRSPPLRPPSVPPVRRCVTSRTTKVKACVSSQGCWLSRRHWRISPII